MCMRSTCLDSARRPPLPEGEEGDRRQPGPCRPRRVRPQRRRAPARRRQLARRLGGAGNGAARLGGLGGRPSPPPASGPRPPGEPKGRRRPDAAARLPLAEGGAPPPPSLALSVPADAPGRRSSRSPPTPSGSRPRRPERSPSAGSTARVTTPPTGRCGPPRLRARRLSRGGAGDDRLVREGPPARPAERHRRPADARFLVLPGVGHTPTWDDPELVAQTLLEGSAR